MQRRIQSMGFDTDVDKGINRSSAGVKNKEMGEVQ